VQGASKNAPLGRGRPRTIASNTAIQVLRRFVTLGRYCIQTSPMAPRLGVAIPGRAAETVSPSPCPVQLSRPVPESEARRQRLRCVEIVPRRRPDCGCLGVIRPELSGYESATGSIVFLESAEISHRCREAVLLRKLTDTRLMDQLR
jgi:hypothetical protein